MTVAGTLAEAQKGESVDMQPTATNAALAGLYPEIGAGGYTRFDGNIEFYGRINALLRDDMHVLDLGAGRGRQLQTASPMARSLLRLQGKVARLSGIDVDAAVLANPGLDDAQVYDGKRIPFGDATIDLVFSDWVLEHVENAALFAGEIDRVLKPGGWFCARTPNSLSFVAIASRLVPNRLHASVLQRVQKGRRRSEDVFPTYYRLNTPRKVRRHFPPDRWLDCSYGYSSEPAYHFNKSAIVRLMASAQYLKKPLAAENLFVFVQKR
jgi:SAM-dependent methyltransferase